MTKILANERRAKPLMCCSAHALLCCCLFCSVNLIVADGLDTPHDMYKNLILFVFVNLLVPEGFPSLYSSLYLLSLT